MNSYISQQWEPKKYCKSIKNLSKTQPAAVIDYLWSVVELNLGPPEGKSIDLLINHMQI